MLRVAVIATGGTFGSQQTAGSVSVDPLLRYVHQEVSGLGHELNLDVWTVAPLAKASEDMQPNDWLRIACCIEETIEQGAQGVVVIHGTDTLPYTASFIAMMCGHLPCKICFTGAMFPPDSGQSDARSNLKGALAVVSSSELGGGVYCAFSAGSEAIVVTAALDIKPVQTDEIVYRAMYDNTVARIDHNGLVQVCGKPLVSFSAGVSLQQVRTMDASVRRVLFVHAYPGMDLERYWASSSTDPDILVLHAFHSGTVPTAVVSSILPGRSNVCVAVAPVSSRYLCLPYESTRQLAIEGARFYFDIQAHQIFILAIVRLAAGLRVQDALDPIDAWRLHL